MSKNIILASSSSYRQALLKKLGLTFTAISPDIDETALTKESPSALVERLSISKARAIHCNTPSLIIASDQIAVLDEKILGKPLNAKNAFAQLQACSGKTVRFLTGLCLFNTQSERIYYHCEPFDVTFRSLSDAQISRYIEKDQPFHCAGSFKAESLGIALFEKMQGNDPNSLIGLPLIQLVSFLQQEGIEIP